MEDRCKLQKLLSERDRDLNGVCLLSRFGRDFCAWKLFYRCHGLINIFTVAPAQVAAPVQAEALSVAVRGTHGEPVAGLEVRPPGAAAGQSLRLVHFLTLGRLQGGRGRHPPGGGEASGDPLAGDVGQIQSLPKAARGPSSLSWSAGGSRNPSRAQLIGDPSPESQVRAAGWTRSALKDLFRRTESSQEGALRAGGRRPAPREPRGAGGSSLG